MASLVLAQWQLSWPKQSVLTFFYEHWVFYYAPVFVFPILWYVRDGGSLYRIGVVQTIFRLGRNMIFINLSMNEVSKSTRIAKLRTAPKSTLTAQPHIPTFNVIFPTTLAVGVVAFFKAGRFFAFIALGHSDLRKTSQLRIGPALFSKTLFTEYIFTAIGLTKIEAL